LNDWRSFHEVGPRSDDMEYVHVPAPVPLSSESLEWPEKGR